MIFKPELSVNQKIELPFKSKVSLYLKREDLIHPIISGNKYRKLKYNIAFAKDNLVVVLQIVADGDHL